MDGQVKGWMEGWMGRWMDGCLLLDWQAVMNREVFCFSENQELLQSDTASTSPRAAFWSIVPVVCLLLSWYTLLNELFCVSLYDKHELLQQQSAADYFYSSWNCTSWYCKQSIGLTETCWFKKRNKSNYRITHSKLSTLWVIGERCLQSHDIALI